MSVDYRKARELAEFILSSELVNDIRYSKFANNLDSDISNLDRFMDKLFDIVKLIVYEDLSLPLERLNSRNNYCCKNQIEKSSKEVICRR